ncbi:MAG: DUF3793 family protein [Planctomycetaceae bacterium]|nr:DUF3793 family protein [Planctomycetaceae bacterium]
MFNEIKRVMVNQCSPVFMGIKPAALFPLCSGGCLCCLRSLLPKNIRTLVLRENEGRPLVLLYEKTLLEKTLSECVVRRFLLEQGYPVISFSLFRILRHLKSRFPGGHFPHEIGLFLGYPAEDVAGFIRHKAQNYKFCGYWKVYGDEAAARQLFRQYDLCRECMERYTCGFPAVSLPAALRAFAETGGIEQKDRTAANVSAA